MYTHNLQILVKYGADLEPSDHKESSFHWLIAFDQGDVEEAAKLLGQTKTLPDMTWNHPSVDFPGMFPLGSPLHYAMFFNSPIYAKSMINYFGIPLDWTGSSEVSPLEYGIARQKINVGQILICQGALKLEKPENNVLLELGSNLTPEIWITMAATRLNRENLATRCLDIVLSQDEKLINIPGEGGFTPLMSAAQYHDHTMLKAMLKRGSHVNCQTSPDYDGRTALNLITENKMEQPSNDTTLELLLEAGADLTQRTTPGGKLVIHFAARDDNIVVAEKLLKLQRPGTEVDARTSGFGQTPLHIACQYGSSRVATLLIRHGANLEAMHEQGTFNAWDWDRLTPIAMAACMKRQSMVKLLVDSGSSGLARPPSKHSVLHLAVAEPDGGMMLRMLLGIQRLGDNPSILNSQANGGITPLHLCAGNFARAEYVSLLLRAGADAKLCTDSGHSILDAALATRKRLELFASKFRFLFLSDMENELTGFLATQTDIWESVTQKGGKFELLITVEGNQVRIPIKSRKRYIHKESISDKYGIESEESEIEEIEENDPELIVLEKIMAELNQSIVELTQAGATIRCTDALPQALFNFFCERTI